MCWFESRLLDINNYARKFTATTLLTGVVFRGMYGNEEHKIGKKNCRVNFNKDLSVNRRDGE